MLKVIGTLNYSNDPNRSERFQIIYTYQMKSKKITQIIEILSGEYGETDYRTSDPIKIKQFMKEHGLSEKDIEYYQEYFLYEKVLSDWFAHNPKSRFSLDDLGNVEIVETDVYEE